MPTQLFMSMIVMEMGWIEQSYQNVDIKQRSHG